MSIATQATRSLALFTPLGDDDLLLRRFTGREHLSKLFEYELELLSEKETIDPRSLVGQNVTWRVDRDGEAVRYFNGFIARFRHTGTTDRFTRFRCEVVPWLWFLTQTTDSRIFQNKTTPQIVETIFRDLGFRDFEMRLTETYRPREYCVQYRESDFNFVSRLLEEEGIFYFFRHENGEHRLVLADRATAYEDLPDFDVQLAPPGNTAGIVDQLKDWSRTCSFRPGRVALNDYNFVTPSKKIDAQESTTCKVGSNENFELYDYPARYEDRTGGGRFARLAMEAQEAQHDVVNGSSTYRSFAPGGRMRVAGHRIEDEVGNGYVITGVELQASDRDSYETRDSPADEPEFENRFTCIADSVAFRPPRETPKAIVEGPQTAVVVGPKGEEIYTDEYGRVKVQFHWDREGRFDENSSCWVRVSQSHAGNRWGSIDLPRVGEEVIVNFLEGDPDRPIIKGRTYNAEAMPPFALPSGMTRSGMKSNTHKGSGYNEISMDDTAGKEQLRTNAQYNMDTSVGNNQTLSVGVDRSADVGNKDTLTIGVDSCTEVGNNQATKVGNNADYIVGNRVVIEAGTAITLACGGSTIHMNQAGVITISGTFVTSAAKACNSIVAPMTNISGGKMLNQAGLICLDVGGALHVKGSKTAVKGLTTRVNAGKVVVKGAPIKIGDAEMAKIVVPPPTPTSSSGNSTGTAIGGSGPPGSITSRLPSPDHKEGWAVPGDTNFAGPGHSRDLPFKARPRNNFDLAAKLHDMSYGLNGITFTDDMKAELAALSPFMSEEEAYAEVIGPDWREWRSRKNKADLMFRIMNDYAGTSSPSSATLDELSKVIFDDSHRDFFVPNDGFVNPLTNPEVVQVLNDAQNNYLMIPFEDLPPAEQTQLTIDGERDYVGYVPSDDQKFSDWARYEYAGVWDEITSF